MAERLGEFERIDRFLRPLAAGSPGALGLVDDAALLDVPAHRRLVVTTDTMVESVHYLPDTAPESVARKLLRVNLSDLAAMGAEPRAYALSLALPQALGTDWLARFADGLRADQEVFGIGLLGGDSVSTPGPPVLTATLFGEVDRGRALLRGGGRAGDTVWVSGTPGDAVIGLAVARGGLEALDPDDRRALQARYDRPEPRVALGRALIGVATAALDVSDGLVADLGRLCRASRVGAVVEAARLPRSPALTAALAADPSLVPTAVAAGDDYELVFSAPPEAADAVRRAGEDAGIAVTQIGTLVDGQGVVVQGAAGRPVDAPAGWTHF